jgi:RNA polymerase sigma factor (sigma-70 family)
VPGHNEEEVSTDEQAALYAARAGDPSGYEALVRRYSALAHRTAVLFGAASDADDVVQEAFVKAFRSLDGFRQEASFRAWLVSIVVNETSNLRRAARRRTNLNVRLSLLPVPEVAVPEALVEAGERRARLLAAIESLSARDRAVVTCRYLLELSEAETARILGWPAGTVKSRLSRALRKLHAELAVASPSGAGVARG